MKIVYSYREADLQKIKELGFDTVVGSFSSMEMDEMVQLGLKCIYHGLVEHPAICGYYLFDEPDVGKITIEQQEVEIERARKFSSLPLFIACIEEVEQQCSRNFDYYMMDIYYSNKMSKFKNFLNAAMSSLFIQILYKGKKVMPIIGLYDDNGDFTFAGDDQLKFNAFFRAMFKGDDCAAFMWAGDKVSCSGIVDRLVYQSQARYVNTFKNRTHWFRPLLYPVAWLFLKINPLLGKYKITIP